jgi:hypothetical protein
VLAACAFPIYVWAIIRLLNEIPAAILRFSIEELVGVIAYTLAFALLESLLVSAALVLLAAILPRKLFLQHFVPIATVLIFISAVWFILLHQYDQTISQWGGRQFLPWLLLVAGSVLIPYLLVQKSEKIRKIIVVFIARLSVLSYLYYFLSIVGIFIVMVRNISG